jgi:carbon-monoxide dehydrogenase medium subunit
VIPTILGDQMKAPDFDYLRPANLDAALAMLAEHDGNAVPLAGGQSLMPMMNFRVASPEVLIDLADVAELRGITRNGDHVRIGAMTRYVQLSKDPIILADVPLIGMALPHIAHDAIRNRGTIGGSLALADPAAEMPALMLALDAAIEVVGANGTRLIKADNFFLSYFETVLEKDELITAVVIPTASNTQSFGFCELTQRHGDYALAGVAVSRTDAKYRIAFFGVADRAVRVAALEDTVGDDLEKALAHLDEIEFTDDGKANAATRQRLAGVALTRALEEMTS